MTSVAAALEETVILGRLVLDTPGGMSVRLAVAYPVAAGGVCKTALSFAQRTLTLIVAAALAIDILSVATCAALLFAPEAPLTMPVI